jgi:hypothetical protein
MYKKEVKKEKRACFFSFKSLQKIPSLQQEKWVILLTRVGKWSSVSFVSFSM